MNNVNKINLSEQTKFQLSDIRKSCSKKLSKYVIGFDYMGKTLIVLSATISGICIISFASVVGAPDIIASASLTLIFPLTTGKIKKILSITRSKRKSMIRDSCVD